MPQLNFTPWFSTLLYFWLVLMILLPLKILAYPFTSPPCPQPVQDPKTSPWVWPWQ